MSIAAVNGIELYYDTYGDPDDPTLVLIGGLGVQSSIFPEAFCLGLVDRFFHVVRFDNRDQGLSTKFADHDVDAAAVHEALQAGREPDIPYRLSDMADDVVGLLDDLGVERAHLLGMSMGGMIAQVLAIAHPDRVLTLTNLMSTTGENTVGQPSAEALEVLLVEGATDRASAIENGVRCRKTWGSPEHIDEDALREFFGACWDRDPMSTGQRRQFAALLADGSRADELAGLDVPSLVMHGSEDKLIDKSGGERLAELIPGTEYLEIEGLGHDLPPYFWPQITEAITQLVLRAR